MCPYCGEEVPQDSSKCWKCGTELSHGEGGAAPKGEGDDLEVPDDDDEDGGGGKPTALIECPYCGEPVNKKSIRCRECGRALQNVKSGAAQAALFKWGVWAVVLVVAISSITAVIIYAQKRSTAQERASKAIGATYEAIVGKVQPLSKGFKEERRREVWEKDFERRFVHWTDGTFLEHDPATNKVKIAHAKNNKDKPDVIVTFLKSEEELTGLKVGDKIEYSARLVGYGEDGFAFTLADGMLDKKEPK